MTLRQKYAGQAMAAMIAKAPFFDREGEHGNPIDLEQFRADIAVSAVEYADALIAALGDTATIAAQAAEIERLRGALDLIARHRYDCHAYDDDMGHPLREFDVEDVKIMECAAKTALAAKP